MSPPTVGFADPGPARRRRCVLDASVLYQELLRNLLLWVAAEGGLDPCWSERILEETRRNLIADRLLVPAGWERLRTAMLASFPDAMLDQAAADAIEDQMPNHEKDRHVLAAAVAGDAELVITSNLRHFERADLEKVGKQALSADQLLCELLATEPELLHAAMEQLVAVMRIPHLWSVAELLGRLAGLGHGDALAPLFVKAATAKFEVEATPPPPPRSSSNDR
jgi:predicted nucleic acid-binding protein